jgi:flagellar motor protein MotB
MKMVNFFQPSKKSIQNKSNLLPEKISTLERKLELISHKFNQLPNIDELLVMGFNADVHENTPKRDPFQATTQHEQQKRQKNKRAYKELPDVRENCEKLFYDIEPVFQSFLKLVENKTTLKEEALVRKAKIRTGNLKKEIDRNAPDEKLFKISQEIEMAYKKVSELSLFFISRDTMTAISRGDYNSAFQDSFEQILQSGKPEINNVSVNKIMHKLIELRQEIINHYFVSYNKSLRPDLLESTYSDSDAGNFKNL